MLLAGDIGGSKTLLRLAEPASNGKQRIVAEQNYVSPDWGDLTALVQAFLSEIRKNHGEVNINAACFGIEALSLTGRPGSPTCHGN